jgi:hypothetical protein
MLTQSWLLLVIINFLIYSASWFRIFVVIYILLAMN